MAPAPSVTLPRDLRATSGLAEESCTEDAGDDARKERDEADDHRPVHRFEPVFHVRLHGVEPLVDLFKSLVDLFKSLVELFKSLVDLFKALVDLVKAPVDLVKAPVDLVKAPVDVVEALVDVLPEIVQPLVGPRFPCHHSDGSDHT